MIKKVIKFLLFIVVFIILIILYLSIFGINTQVFNSKIKNEVSNINKKVNLELKSVKILLNPYSFSANIKTFDPEISFNNKRLKFNFINTNVSFKSLINQKLTIDDIQISTKQIKLKDIVSLTRLFKDSPELFILEKITKEGFLVGDINLNLDSNGKIKKNYLISGFIKNGKFSLLNRYNIHNLNLVFNIKKKNYLLENVEAEINQLKIFSPFIKIKENNDLLLINGKINNTEKEINLEVLNNLLGDVIKSFDLNNLKLTSENEFSFNINKKYKIHDFNLISKINLNNAEYKIKLPFLKKYLPNFDDLIKLKNHKILINYKKNNFNIKGNGNISINDALDSLDYELLIDNSEYKFNTNLNIEKNSILIEELRYKKNENLKAILKLQGIYQKNKKIKLNLISLLDDDKNKFLIKGLDLNKKFKISSINLLDFNFVNNNKIKNQIYLKKENEKYKIKGKSFDATKIIEDMLSSDNKELSSIFTNNFNSNIDIKIDKTYLDNVVFVNNLVGNVNIKNSKINKINLDSTFPNKKKLTLTVSTNKNKEKITTLYSDYPKPLIKQYKFIKGFQEGVLDFHSINKNGISNSVLIIDNFKVKEVPVFAKLLTLASLQGIADLLTGEGIRFTDFEMKFSNKESLMTIDEMYAIGPAVSIMMEGYIESKKLVSLKGTLVPATTINRTISSIPLIGNILVGKKTGEGVFGVSFKIKGPPSSLKTTVNPVKTLTPRFITRTLEKIKKN